MTAANVLLLRAPRTDGQQDSYETHLTSSGFDPCSLPVLETGTANLGELQRILRDGPGRQGLSGVVITSGRAVETWRDAVQALSEDEAKIDQQEDWRQTPFYVVGESTATALQAITVSYPSSSYSPGDILGAAESGTSERLAQYIVSRLRQRDGRKRLLYLTGDKNREALPGILDEAGIQVLSLQVYKTHGSPEFETSLQVLLRARSSKANDAPWWIVFFAPSAADFAVPILRRYFQFTEKIVSQESAHENARIRSRIAAIGPTTSAHLDNALSLHVNVTSLKPRPADLTQAIVTYPT